MSCIRRTGQAAALCAAVVLGWPEGHQTRAQTTSAPSSKADLLRPVLDGNPDEPPQFRRPGAEANAKSKSLVDYSYRPGAGMGTTGFDSTNTRKKAAATPSGKALPPGRKAAPKTYGAPPIPPSPKTATPRVPRGLERQGATPYRVAADPYERPDGDGVPLRRRILPDETPFDPIGVQVGAFTFKPAIDIGGGYDTNPARVQQATPSLFYTVAPELLFKSNWSRHEFAGELRGSYVSFDRLPSRNRPSFDGRLIGRVDVTRDTRLDLETKMLVGTDNPGSPNIQADLARLPIFTTWGGSAGLGHRFNRFEIVAKGGAERTVYQASTFTDGTTQSNDDRNYNRYFTVERVSYELSPAMKPFLEIGADRRVHDLEVDLSGLRRDSDGQFAKVGSTFELSRIIIGEAAVGWVTRQYKDPRLDAISGVTFDGSLNWLVSGLTTVRLTGRTAVDETTVFGVSGVFVREVALQVDHAFRRWLIATGKVVRANDDYVGSNRNDDRTSASFAITYKMNRDMHLKAEVRRDWLRSSVPGFDYDANVFLVGARLAR